MSKNGFKIIDAEMHIMEPTDLWDNYIDPAYKENAPRRIAEREWDVRTILAVSYTHLTLPTSDLV